MDDEEEKEEFEGMSPEEKEKVKKLHELMDETMIKMGDILLAPGEVEATRAKIIEKFKMVEVPYGKRTLRSFLTGFQLALGASKSGDWETAMKLMAATQHLIKIEEDKVAGAMFKTDAP